MTPCAAHCQTSEAPSSASEIAAATIVGAAVLALGNLVVISIAVAWPPQGLGLRLAHHGFDLLEVLGVGALLALPAVVAARLPRVPAWVAWVAFVAASIWAATWLMGMQLEGAALRLFGGRHRGALFPAFCVGMGLVVPAVHLLAGLLSRRRWLRFVPLMAGVGGLLANQLLFPDDYPGTHALLCWASGVAAGTSLAPRVAPRLMAQRGLPLILAGLGLLAVAWAPPNDARLELLRHPSSSASWVLARLAWRAPELNVPLPSVVPAARPTIAAASRYADDPVVVLVTVEALRGELLSSNRFAATLPNLVALRDESAYFPRAVSASSQTTVALTTLFTGRYFSQLQWEPFGEGKDRFAYAAGDKAARFPELLAAAGIPTQSYLGLKFLGGAFGVARGFGKERLLVKARKHAHAHQLMEPLLSDLRAAGGGPHFYYTHLMEPHEPYDRGEVKEGSAFERYVSEVGVVDRWIAKLTRLLRQRFPDRGYLVLCGDHGEAFGEHGTVFHSKTLYQEMVHVPLLLFGPGIAAGRFEERVGQVDLGPTILQLMGLGIPEEQMGESLLPLVEGRMQHLTRPLLAEARLARAIWGQGDLKVIEDSRRHVIEAYDLRRDPGEAHNLFGTEPARVYPLVAQLRALVAGYRLEAPADYELPYKR